MNAVAHVRAPVDANPELLRAALEASPAGFAVVEEGRVLYRNAAFASVLPVNPGEAIEAKVFHSPDDVLRRSVSIPFQLEGRNLAVVSASPLAVGEPVPQLTELMVAGIAHDFNNLLAGLRLYCDLLAASLTTGTKPHGYAVRVRKTSDACKALVQQLMAVSRMAKVPAEILSWNQVISAIQSFLVLLNGQKIPIFNELEPELHCVSLDPVTARRILLNLVLNARDAMPSGGNVRLSTRNAGEWVELIVGDHGAGMDAATRSHIFEPYFTTKGAGTGLGLHTVRALVEENGGTLTLVSAPDAGTEAVVRLPNVGDSHPLGKKKISRSQGQNTRTQKLKG